MNTEKCKKYALVGAALLIMCVNAVAFNFVPQIMSNNLIMTTVSAFCG